MSKNFSEMTLDERVAVVNKRFGGEHPDRISTPAELIEIIGKPIFFVMSPFGNNQDIGNGFLYEWVADRLEDKEGALIESADQVSLKDEEKYICINDNADIFKALSIKDFNILPNTYNNHAAFSTKEGAEAYVMFRKLQWSEDTTVNELVNEYDFWMSDEQLKSTREKETE